MDLAGRIVRRFRSDPDAPFVTGIEGEDADQLFEALGSETSRAVLAACYEDGRTRSELADELETSIQSIGYHVDKLEAAGLIEAVETRYGANGSEVAVYEPSKRAVVIAAGEPTFVDRLAETVRKLFAPVVLAGLLSMVVGVLVRGPQPTLMFGSGGPSSGSATATATVGTGAIAAGVAFVCSVSVIALAARNGIFDGDGEESVRRTGLRRTLLGEDASATRRYAAVVVGIAAGTFLALDTLAVATGYWLSVGSWVGLQLAVPASVVVAAVFAYRNDGLLVSWGAVSAPVVGGWAYLVAGSLSRGGFEPTLVAIGPAVVAIVAAPVGSVAYLVGRAAARRWRGATLSNRTVALLVAHPAVVVGLVVGGL